MESEKRGNVIEKEEAIIDQEIEAIDQQLRELENNNSHYTKSKPVQNGTINIQDVIGISSSSEKQYIDEFLTPCKIKAKKRELTKVILSGIHSLDKRIIGFNPCELSIWSGSNGSGKSSILSQLALEGIQRNFKVALFSGELRADRVLDWLHLQAAGKEYVQTTKYENYYIVPDNTKSKINTWLEGKLYVYNNDFGNGVENVLLAIKRCIVENGISMVIIDNMMSLDLAKIGGEKYERQTSLVLALCAFAKQYNIHIHFVAHPRKSLGFLRKNDISGTADITNAADNVFIVHRVNSDFKRTTKQDLGLKEDNPIFNYSNVIEICKNRDLGIADEFIGVYFEKESKRFLNVVDEAKYYGWVSDKDGFVKCNDKNLPFSN